MISKQVNGVTEYRLIYAGQLSPIAKVDGSGNTLETYVYGIGVNSPDYILKDGTKYRVIKDHLGSTRMIVDSSTGEVVKTLRYSEFGEITEETGTFNTIFGFAGGIRDTDSGLTKFGARWYDPETGRWMEKEPLGFEGSDNFYSYCDGDPVNYVDVTGLKLEYFGDPAMKDLIEKLKKSETGKELVRLLDELPDKIIIEKESGQANYWGIEKGTGNPTCFVNPTLDKVQYPNSIQTRPPEVGLAHELIHIYNYLKGLPNTEETTRGYAGENPFTENKVRKDLGVKLLTGEE